MPRYIDPTQLDQRCSDVTVCKLEQLRVVGLGCDFEPTVGHSNTVLEGKGRKRCGGICHQTGTAR